MVFKLRKVLLTLALLFIIGCVQAKDFDYGVKQVNNLNLKYNATMDTYPNNVQQIDAMLNDFRELKKLQLESGKQPLSYILDYRILNLEAEKLYMKGQKYGAAGTTKGGFGCKSSPLIIESASLRNMSALKGFESVNLLREFLRKYPEEAKSVALSEKNALFLNATFYQISKDAGKDSSIINNFCPQNETLVLYKKEIKAKTNLSEDFINNLTYDLAVPIWKKIRGIG